MTFKLNHGSVGRRRYRSAFSFSVDTGPSIVVTGGEHYEDSYYAYKVFKSSGSLSVSGGDLTFEVLAVAGGGPGGDRDFYWSGRGGGAGGVLGASIPVYNGESLDIVIGAGGAAWQYPTATGANSTITKNGSLLTLALGGGGGGDPWGYNPPTNGGSGGGGGGLGTAGQGYNGGAGNGAGGGAGGPGQDGDSNGSDGGPGTSAFSSWGSVTGTGELVAGTYYYGGGGASIGWNEPVQGRGGDGGGSGNQRAGGGGLYPAAIPGLTNTGGGGNSRAAGGSGIVIFKYLKPGVVLPAVSGGSTGNDGTFYYTAFTATDVLNITNGPLEAEVLVVAGGGGGGAGGGYEAGGGGGAGGIVHETVTIVPGSFDVVVGAGGAFNSNGNNSYINEVTSVAIGGGFGGPYGAGAPGGSGGGAPGWGAHNQPGSGTAGQGNRGGYGTYDYGASLPGGGGGANAVGGDASSGNQGGNGGVGTSEFSAWGWATETGHHVNNTTPYFAGGGGGGTNWGQYLAAGSGGYGGGGNGGVNGEPGWSTTGGGGGGSNNNYASAGNGGSGVVILKYPMSSVSSVQ